jgi:hypothetical protein
MPHSSQYRSHRHHLVADCEHVGISDQQHVIDEVRQRSISGADDDVDRAIVDRLALALVDEVLLVVNIVNVRTGTPPQDINVLAAVQDVLARSSAQEIAAGPAEHAVIARAALGQVNAFAAIKDVRAIAA